MNTISTGKGRRFRGASTREWFAATAAVRAAALVVGVLSVGWTCGAAPLGSSRAWAAVTQRAVAAPGLLVAPTVRAGPIRAFSVLAVHRALRAMMRFCTAVRLLDDKARREPAPASRARPRSPRQVRLIAHADARRRRALELAKAVFTVAPTRSWRQRSGRMNRRLASWSTSASWRTLTLVRGCRVGMLTKASESSSVGSGVALRCSQPWWWTDAPTAPR